MADEQDVTNKDVKTSVDYNTSMIESMFLILQTIQGQNMKIEKRIGALESDVHSLRSKSKMADGESSKTADGDGSKVQGSNLQAQPGVNKEVLKTCLTDMSVDVKSFVKDEAADITQGNQTRHDVTNNNMAELEKKLMLKLDVLMTTQGNTAKRVNQIVKEVQGLKETDSEMSEKLSGLIRCSAHGSIKVHQELVALTASADNSNANLSSEMKTQTRRLKSNQDSVKEIIGSELSVLKDMAENQIDELKSVKDIAKTQTDQLDSVKDIVEHLLPHSDKVMLKEELKRELESLKKADEKPTFLTRKDFSSQDDYGKYVEEHARVGMKVRYWYDSPCGGIVKGDVGTVTALVIGGLQVDWSPKMAGAITFRLHELIG